MGLVQGRCQRQESVLTIDTEAPGQPIPEDADDAQLADLHAALVDGIRSYCRKTGQSRVVLGLSGGIDSAVVLPWQWTHSALMR